MGDGLKRIAKQCGGLVASSGGVVVRYGRDGARIGAGGRSIPPDALDGQAIEPLTGVGTMTYSTGTDPCAPENLLEMAAMGWPVESRESQDGTWTHTVKMPPFD